MTLSAAALALALVAVQPPDPPARPPNPFQAPQPGRDRGTFPTRRPTTPGRFAVTGVGNTTFLLDTATGDTWVLDRKDESTWRPVRRPDAPPAPEPKRESRPPAPGSVESLGVVTPARVLRVNVPADGVVARVNAREGDEVKAGDVLAVVTDGVKADDTPVTSPAAGTVLAVRVREGSSTRSSRGGFAPERAGAAFEVADLRDLEVTVNLPEGDVSRVTKGQKCAVRPAAGGPEYPGEVAAVAPVVDPQSQTVAVRVKVAIPAEAPPLRSGATVRVAFPAK
jgi:multidrug efflux pump subunit AcrA (membrane-fusion protein)